MSIAFRDGAAILADAEKAETLEAVLASTGKVSLIIADPPYGNILKASWDRKTGSAAEYAKNMVAWTMLWRQALIPGGAFYVWGGTGRPGFRPFFHYLTMVETVGEFELASLITWSKKRAYGVQHNYLYTREECAYFVNGDARKPACFNIPLLSEKRGYAGYDPRFPAKSEYLRRTAVWTDITEVMRGKKHDAEKAQRLMEIPIEVHTKERDWVIDLFSGSGTTAAACRKLGRRFYSVESDPGIFEQLAARFGQ